jgi:hypothetical protein
MWTGPPSARANGFRFDGSGSVTCPSQPALAPRGMTHVLRAVRFVSNQRFAVRSQTLPFLTCGSLPSKGAVAQLGACS